MCLALPWSSNHWFFLPYIGLFGTLLLSIYLQFTRNNSFISCRKKNHHRYSLKKYKNINIKYLIYYSKFLRAYRQKRLLLGPVYSFLLRGRFVLSILSLSGLATQSYRLCLYFYHFQVTFATIRSLQPYN
jgi:hypothetical protein